MTSVNIGWQRDYGTTDHGPCDNEPGSPRDNGPLDYRTMGQRAEMEVTFAHVYSHLLEFGRMLLPRQTPAPLQTREPTREGREVSVQSPSSSVKSALLRQKRFGGRTSGDRKSEGGDGVEMPL